MAVQIRLSELNDDEWFFVTYFRGVYPAAAPDRIAKAQREQIGLSPAQIEARLKAGLESFRARGAIEAVTDPKTGQPALDQNGLPLHKFTAKLIVELSEAPESKARN